jgi:hypothetical protein
VAISARRTTSAREVSMNGRRVLVVTSLVVALGVAAPGAGVAKRGGTDRPVKGSTSGTSTLDLATGTGTSQGSGTFSHLGKTTYTLNFTFALTGPTTVAISGTGTLVAANGDQVFVTFTGTSTVPSPVPAVGQTAETTLVSTITGGTGRFSDASGTTTSAVRQEIVSVVGTTVGTRDTATHEGRISY